MSVSHISIIQQKKVKIRTGIKSDHYRDVIVSRFSLQLDKIVAKKYLMIIKRNYADKLIITIMTASVHLGLCPETCYLPNQLTPPVPTATITSTALGKQLFSSVCWITLLSYIRGLVME